MPREGYISLNIREEDAMKAKEEAQKMGITIVEYFSRLIESAQTDRLIHESLFKGALLQIYNSVKLSFEIAIYFQKQLFKELDSNVGKQVDLAYVYRRTAWTLTLTNDLIDKALEPMKELLYPLIWTFFSGDPDALQKSISEKIKDRLTAKFYNINDFKKALTDIVVYTARLRDIFPDDPEVQRLGAALKPYVDEIERILPLLDRIDGSVAFNESEAKSQPTNSTNATTTNPSASDQKDVKSLPDNKENKG